VFVNNALMKSPDSRAGAEASGESLNIVIIPPTLACTNLGDIALLQSTVSRLHALLTMPTLHVLTSDPARLREHCPGTSPLLFRSGWTSIASGAAESGVTRGAASVLDLAFRTSGPVFRELLRWRMNLGQRHWCSHFARYLQSVAYCDAVVASGAGGFNDLFMSYTDMFLATMRFALNRGKPVAAFSQGLGPVRKTSVIKRSRAIFPQMSLLGLRESTSGKALANEFGMAPDRLRITGDDAVEMAYQERRERPGGNLGVNVRVDANTAITFSDVLRLRESVQRFALSRSATLCSLPVALKRDADRKATQVILNGHRGSINDGAEIVTPRTLILQTGSCRVVVTSAYHVAVFALAQGIPAICLAASEYFTLKFEGLAGEFPSGCEIIPLRADGAELMLERTLERLWSEADHLRRLLLASAMSQRDKSRSAYEDFVRRIRCEKQITVASPSLSGWPAV
jgi:colanic acid/amylovoran biosynthesis protein